MRLDITLAATAAALTLAGTAGAQVISDIQVVATDDAVLDADNPSTNFDTIRSGSAGDAPNCLTGMDRYAVLLGFDQDNLPDMALAEGDGELNIRLYFNANASTVTLYEIPTDFDESSVTFDSYLGAGATLSPASFGVPVASFTGAAPQDPPRMGQTNSPGTTFVIPEDSIQRLLDGDIAGFAINGGNYCLDLKESFGTGPDDGTPFYDPALQFSFSLIPEPASAGLLGVGALGLLRHRR